VASSGLLIVFTREYGVSTSLEALEAEVLKLAPAERSHLLERLIESLDLDPEIEEAWEHEADRREAELEAGSVTAVPGEEAMARLRSRLSR
jgi:putative addiction module component (TIGR02574 family)